MASFPPLAIPDAANKLQVQMNFGVVRIEQISPADSSWKLRVQVDTYWDQAYCDASYSNQAACNAGRFGIAELYFVSVDNLLNPDGATANSQLEASNIFASNYVNGHCLQADYSDISFILTKNYVSLWFPYEAHLLQFSVTSVFSVETVQLIVLDPQPDDSLFSGTMPPGWISEDGVRCVATVKEDALVARGFQSRGGALQRSQIVCSIVVSSVDESWFLTAFIFWLVTMAANMLMGIGTFGGATTMRDVEEALVSRGSFSSGLVLAYVFVVPANPYNLPIAGGGVPTSTQIFVWGLAILTFSAFYSFVLGKWLTIGLRERHKHSSWYEPFLHPHELIDDLLTEEGPLTPKSNRQMTRVLRLRPKWMTFGGFGQKRGHGHATATASVDDAVTVELPAKDPPPSSDAAESEHQRGSVSDEELKMRRLRALQHRRQVACVDMAVWVALHVTAIVAAVVLLAQASQGYQDDITKFKAAALVGTDAASTAFQAGL